MNKNPAYLSKEEKFQALVAFTREAMHDMHVPGVAIGLIGDGEDFTAGLGITSVENPLEVTPQTLFQIGSTTKTFTATAIVRLLEQGKLSLDDCVRKFLPDFMVSDVQAAEGVTIRHLLTHTCGWLGDFFPETGDGDDAIARYVSLMRDLPQRTPLGAYYSYNNAALIVAGRVIEEVTGKTYEAAIREMLFDRLEMHNSFFFPGEVMLHRFAVGHILQGQTAVVADPWPVPRFAAPAGGVISDALDQLKYMHFHMGDGSTPSGEQLLTRELLESMRTPQVPIGDGNWIGLTWTIEEIGGIKFFSHGGTTNGQESDFWIAPEVNTALTVLTNLDRGDVLHKAVREWVFKHFLGVEKQLPETIQLSVTQLEEYAASFVTSSGDMLEVSLSEGGILLTHVLSVPAEETRQPGDALPPMRARFIEQGRFIILDQPFKDIIGEFLCREDGEITWLRVGGRILPRKRKL